MTEGGCFFLTIHRGCVKNTYSLMFWLKNNMSYSVTWISTESSTICGIKRCWTTLQHAPKCLAEFSPPPTHYTQPLLHKDNCCGAPIYTHKWSYKMNLGFFASFLSINAGNLWVRSFQQWPSGRKILTSIWKAEWLNSHFPFCCKTIHRRSNLFKTAPWCIH